MATGRKAGRNIRELAFRRRFKAMTAFGSAIVLLVFPFIFNRLWQDLLAQFVSPDAQSPAAPTLPPLFYIGCVVASLACVLNGRYWWQRANRADQGAKGEEDVAQAIADLEQIGWTVEYGLWLGKGLGDADIVCVSPRQKAYVIDVKSHRGTIVTDGQKLYRKMGHQKHAFEKDFLKQVMKQAFRVKQLKEVKFVTPILAFSQAQVATPMGKTQGVYVVEKDRLASLLKKLG